MELTLTFVNALMLPALSPLVLGVIRKTKAHLQSRRGASVLQPYRDLAKLFKKDEVVSEDASWVFMAAPYIVGGTTMALACGIPLLGFAAAYPPLGDLLVFVYLLATGTFFLALAGIDTGSGFGGFGASREMLFAALIEGGLIFSLVVAAFIAHTPILASMPSALANLSVSELLPLLLAAAAFFIALLAENARYPVDNPATHLELTMVHEAMILEYSGQRLALMEWASSTKLLVFIALFVTIFMPWGPAATSTHDLTGLLLWLGVFLLKVLVVALSIAGIESSMAKFRIFRVPDFLLTSFVLSVIALILIVI